VIGATAAYAISILVLRRSVLTEKVARHGVHLTREYSVDPLEVLFVGDVMSEIEAAAATANGTSARFNEAEARLGGQAAELDDAPIVFTDDTLRHVAYVMADSGRTELPVAERSRPEAPVGTVRLEELLKGRLHDLDEERHRTRELRPLELLGVGRTTTLAGRR